MIYPIVIYGAPQLRAECTPLAPGQLDTKQLIADMFLTLESAEGVGLAAPQIGILRRVVIVVDAEENMIELVNPVIVSREGEQGGWEGCLSVPNQYGWVTRPNLVTVRAQDRNGKEFVIEGRGLLARALCHEIDHLSGILFKDRAIRMLDPDEA